MGCDVQFERANPDDLAGFDPASKRCTMNCGPCAGDPRSSAERMFLCGDCEEVEMVERKRFYVGVKSCGCITACLVDDEYTTANEVADFAKQMHKAGRNMKHVELTEAEFMASFKRCECGHSDDYPMGRAISDCEGPAQSAT